MRVLIMEPGKLPEERDVEEGAILALTGGYATQLGRWALPMPSHLCAMVREFDWEGQAQNEGVAPNFETESGHVFYGPLIVVRSPGADFVALDDKDVEWTTRSIARHLTRIGMPVVPEEPDA